jgi:hypothetical protein
MDDLITELERYSKPGRGDGHPQSVVCRKAAAALRASAEREKELVEALEPFARYAAENGFGLNHRSEELPDGDGVGWVYLTNGDFRRAARAIKAPAP